jgi:hypothetical protein
MNISLRRLSLFVAFVFLIASCAESESQGISEVAQNLQQTNLDSSQFPWKRGLADGRLKRWDIERDGLIPIKLNGSTLAQEAVIQIETVIHISLFDTTSIATLPDNMIARGIIVSEGTAVGPRGLVTKTACGNVSSLPRATDYPKDFYNSEGEINTRLYVNLSSKKCTASQEIAIHEIGHALGLGKHFSGFGSGNVIAPSFWQVLYILYSNDVGAFADDLEITLLDL